MQRKEAMALQKQLQSIQLELLKNLYENIPNSQWKEEFPLIEPMLKDTFFTRTGLETDSLDIAFAVLKLDNDPEYLQMIKECNEAFKLLENEAKERGKI
tara:strand:+ start:562 stop:858 length:297 start_codon:yes stop_codon:yes gene_type:complete